MRSVVYSTPAFPLAVGADAEEVDTDDVRSVTYLLRNDTATNSIYLGSAAATATAAQGFTWATDEGMLEIALEPGEELWARSAGTAQTVHLLRQGRIAEVITPAAPLGERPVVGSVAEELYAALEPIMVDDA